MSDAKPILSGSELQEKLDFHTGSEPHLQSQSKINAETNPFAPTTHILFNGGAKKD